MKEKIDAIRERLAKATPGPWAVREEENPLNALGREKFPEGIKYLNPIRWIVTEAIHPQLGGPLTINSHCSTPYREHQHYQFMEADDAALIANAPADLQFLLDELDKALADSRRLMRFAGEALTDGRVDGSDWDASEVEQAAEDSGLVETEERVTPCRDDCACAEYTGKGVTTKCLVLTDFGNRCVRVYRDLQDEAMRIAADAVAGNGMEPEAINRFLHATATFVPDLAARDLEAAKAAAAPSAQTEPDHG